MRNIKNNLIKCFTFVLVLLCAFSLVSCKKDNDKDKPVKPTEPVKIELNADKEEINKLELLQKADYDIVPINSFEEA